MRLSDFRVERSQGRVRASAEMVWEDCGRDAATLFFEVDEEPGAGMEANPHAFLLAAAVPALRYGERRIAVDAPVCPMLLEGLGTALDIINAWHYGSTTEAPVIEAAERMSQPSPPHVERAGFFFSGGIDSYATLRLNDIAYPEPHPLRFREGVLAFGLEQDDPEKFALVTDSLRRSATDRGLALTTIATNAYLLYRAEDAKDDFRFWWGMYEGSALAAIAHSLAHRFSSVSISGSTSPGTVMPSGSHMMLDHGYSSSDLRIHHAGGHLTRLQKVALVVAGDVGARDIRVCNDFRHYRASSLNCGVCSKCIRTKLEFLAVGRTDLLAAFAIEEVSSDLVRTKVHIRDPCDLEVCSELVEPLAARGFRDIARVLARMRLLFRLLGPDVGVRRLPGSVTRRLQRATVRGRLATDATGDRTP